VALFSRSGLPDAVVAGLSLRPGERVVEWGSGPGPEPGDTAYVVATTHALHLPGDLARVPWDLVQRASWAVGVLDVRAQPEPGARARRVVLTLDRERDLPAVVRERVTASIEVQQHLTLDVVTGSGADSPPGVTVAARRVSDTGRVRWSVSFDEGTDGRDPAVRAAAAVALADLRAALGL
jgi:hypothetical protein